MTNNDFEIAALRVLLRQRLFDSQEIDDYSIQDYQGSMKLRDFLYLFYFEVMLQEKALYDHRLKADVVAMLEEIRLEATKMRDSQVNSGFWENYDFIVKKRIDKLKGEETNGKREDL